MPDSTDHGKVVLTAIFGGRGSIKALDKALTLVSSAHFEDSVQAALFEMAQRYADQTRGVLNRDVLKDVLRNHEPGKTRMYLEYFDLLANGPMPDGPGFLHSLDQLRDLSAERQTMDVLSVGSLILREGWQPEDNRERKLRGHEDARAYVLAGLAEVERDSGLTVTPEGNVLDEAGDILATYGKAKDMWLRGETPGVRFGIPELDEKMEGGIMPGELALILGWTSAGKSSLCAQWAWDTAVMQGKNAVILTTETLRPQVRIKLVARHSRHPKFGLEYGLNTRDIRSGRLNLEEEKILSMVLADFKTADYGKCDVVQVPDNATISTCGARLAALDRRYHPDLVVIDYLQLLLPDRSRRESSDTADQTGILKSAKRLSGSFRRGDGVALVSPWQISREGRKKLKERGNYSLEDAADTSEAGKSPDLVISLADPEEDTSRGRRAPLELTVLKNRDGPRGLRLGLTADFATNTFTAAAAEADASVLDADFAGV
ncbi:MAG: DnaB-like helicase C-terminal domain-containing protein [Rouxiella badensis]|uniref:DnaB-like helicase C-terminal domain-containing protein n=1 Tax=Rouxiella badensis TaxID=1646377 RepID=UPI003C64D363